MAGPPPRFRRDDDPPERDAGDRHVHIGVLQEKRLRTKIPHQHRSDRRRRDRRDAVDEQEADRDEDQVVRRGAVVGDRDRQRVERIGGQADQEAEQEDPCARGALAAQRDFERRARDHHRRHHQPAVDAIGQRADRKDAERRTDHDGRGKLRRGVRRHADPDRKDGPERDQRAVGRAGGEGGGAGDGRPADEPHEARANGARLGGRIDAGHRHRHDRQREQRPRDGERLKAGRTQRLKHHLARRRSGESGDLVERVKRAPVGVAGSRVDPCLDDGVEPGEHEAEQRPAGEPYRGRHENRHQDDGRDRKRHESGESADVAAAPDDRRRDERARQHAREIGRADEADRQLRKPVDARAQRRRHADERVAADQQHDRAQQSSDGGKGGGHVRTAKGESAPLVARENRRRDTERAPATHANCRGDAKIRHAG